MDGVLQFTPMQQFFILAMNAWMFVIFPIMVIRKLNNITNLLEAQVYEDEDGSNTFESGE